MARKKKQEEVVRPPEEVAQEVVSRIPETANNNYGSPYENENKGENGAENGISVGNTEMKRAENRVDGSNVGQEGEYENLTRSAMPTTENDEYASPYAGVSAGDAAETGAADETTSAGDAVGNERKLAPNARVKAPDGYWERQKVVSDPEQLSAVEKLKAMGIDVSADDVRAQQMAGVVPTAISEEEEEKRVRAMRQAELVGNLGNIANAFVNLYYTGKGAPSMTLPKGPDGSAVETYRAKWQQQRANLATYLQKAREQLRKERLDGITADYKAQMASIGQQKVALQIEAMKAKTEKDKAQIYKMYADVAAREQQIANKYEVDMARLGIQQQQANASTMNAATNRMNANTNYTKATAPVVTTVNDTKVDQWGDEHNVTKTTTKKVQVPPVGKATGTGAAGTKASASAPGGASGNARSGSNASASSGGGKATTSNAGKTASGKTSGNAQGAKKKRTKEERKAEAAKRGF